MSQSFWRKLKDGEQFYVELINGLRIQWGVGASERVAAAQAEARWRRDFPGHRPNRKIVTITW